MGGILPFLIIVVLSLVINANKAKKAKAKAKTAAEGAFSQSAASQARVPDLPPREEAQPAEGEHTPLAPSGEGGFSASTPWMGEKRPAQMADPCRAVSREASDMHPVGQKHTDGLAEGEHTPLAPSGEGEFSEQTQWMGGKHPQTIPENAADPCRALPREALGNDRARRKGASVVRTGQGVLKTDGRSVTQGILWAQVLENRGGHNAWNRSLSR